MYNISDDTKRLQSEADYAFEAEAEYRCMAYGHRRRLGAYMIGSQPLMPRGSGQQAYPYAGAVRVTQGSNSVSTEVLGTANVSLSRAVGGDPGLISNVCRSARDSKRIPKQNLWKDP
jgi:hypothetical protein